MTKKTSPAYRASKEETIPINKLHPFSNHPFHIRHDLEFSELVEYFRERHHYAHHRQTKGWCRL